MCEFEKYGVIGDVYRPKEMATTMVEKSVLFIRFFSIDDANNAQVDLSKSRDANYIIRCHCGVGHSHGNLVFSFTVIIFCFISSLLHNMNEVFVTSGIRLKSFNRHFHHWI